jgi:glycosyltransferase involved in cell wall biosynthesis
MVIQRLRPLFSGQGVQVEALCRVLAARGVEVTILTAGQGHNALERIHGYQVQRLRCDVPLLSSRLRPGRFRSELFGLWTLAWLLRRGRRAGIVHVHALTDALYTAWAYCRLRGLPIVFEMTLLGTDDPLTIRRGGNRLARLRDAIFRRCDGYVAISPALARAYRDAGLPEERLRLIPQGVDIERFAPAADRAAVRRRLDLPAAGPLLVYAGSLIERKGIDVLLRSWQRLHDRRPQASLVLVGNDAFPDDPGAAAFLAEQLSMLRGAAGEAVHRVGVRDDVAAYLQAADVFVFPSRREGFGTVMIEAMACGLPCVVAALPDITDFIFDTPEPSGMVVPQDSPAALFEAVEALLAEPDRARALGAAARRRAVERFSLNRIADDYLAFYRELRQRAGSAPERRETSS